MFEIKIDNYESGSHINLSGDGRLEWFICSKSARPEAARRLRAAADELAEDEGRKKLVEALEDILSGWKYIRRMHGDLGGVGWDRAQTLAEQALAAAKGGRP